MLAVTSPQTLSEADRRTVAGWAADCADRVLVFFEAVAPAGDRPRDAIARSRAFARGELGAAEEIRRRFVAGRALSEVRDPAAVAAVRAAAQAAGVGPELLASGVLARVIRAIQADVADGEVSG
jgi:hypothetical protein